MTPLQRTWFEELHKQRSLAADALEGFGLRGLKKGASDNYSDKAHFVYELLQNADDAGATSVTFHLCADKLIFVHNGTRRFTISNPKTEIEDKGRNRLGDVNSITAYHESTKSDDNLNSIGTFGIGFKAVYLYTREPMIYDGDISFAIEREMVPRVLEGDIPERKRGETAFVLPFNHPDVPVAQAQSEIASKLGGLSYPLLFLNNLRDILIQIDASKDKPGYGSTYTKKVISLGQSDDIIEERIELSHDIDGDSSTSSAETLMVFSRSVKGGHRCSVGYFMDDDEKLVPRDRPVFCFFPTHVKTNLGFVIQAPFQLTNSREVIVANSYNVKLVDSLAALAADSLVCLRELVNSKGERLLDDGILNIVPTTSARDNWYDEDESLSTISFEPFYEDIKDAFASKCILPARSGYASPVHAYWAASHAIAELFDDEQLRQLTGDNDAMWVFCNKPASNDDTSSYIHELVRIRVDDRVLLQVQGPESKLYYEIRAPKFGPINASFTEAQSHEWLSHFYGWVCETQRKIEAAKKLPILLDSEGRATSAYNAEGKREIYLPATVNLDEFPTIADWILDDENGATLVKKLEICPPKEDDVIYRSIVLPLEAKKDRSEINEEELGRQLRYLFEYYKGLPRGKRLAQSDLLERLSDCNIIPACYLDGSEHFYRRPRLVYLPTKLLSAYFAGSRIKLFLDKNRFAQLLNTGWGADVESFASELGVASSLRFIDTQLGDYEALSRKDVPKDRSTWYRQWNEPRMDGLSEAIRTIAKDLDKNKSAAIWKVLASNSEHLDRIFQGTYKYFYRNEREKPFVSSSVSTLKTQPWLFTSKGELKSPANITKRELAGIYNKDSEASKKVIAFLGIRDSNLERLAKSGELTDEDADDIEMALLLRESGIQDKEELRELIEIKRQRDAVKNSQGVSTALRETTKPDAETAEETTAESDAVAGRSSRLAPRSSKRQHGSRTQSSSNDTGAHADREQGHSNGSGHHGDGASSQTLADYAHADWHTLGVTTAMHQQAEDTSKGSSAPGDDTHAANKSAEAARDTDPQQTEPDDELYDARPDMPFRGVNFDTAINRAQETGDRESQKAWSMKILHDVATTSEKYTYAWFSSLLRLEALANDDPRSSRAVSIRFGLVETEKGTKRTLSLRQPCSYVPQRMEDLSDIPLVLHMPGGDRRITIEVASVLSDRLKVKVKDPASIRGIDFRKVVEASINVQSPAFLLQSLIAGFESLDLADNFNLKDTLGENIEFVYGPPGTGKTTYLAREVLIPLVQKKGKGKPRVLVLAPTNKAADVLTSKVLQVMHHDLSWQHWLARFGVTADEQLETSGAFRDREFDFRRLNGIVGVSTIARFPYDYITMGGKKERIQDMDWDYVVVDEASMVPIAHIAYLLHKASPKKFIIAGDPYQIEPVDSGNFWQGENIYSMVGLKSFISPHTEPHGYKVHTLPVQYRSVPAIGNVVSKLTYDGGLRHSRSVKEQRTFPVARNLDITALNIVRFPVRSYEGIYRAKKLGNSPYHIYSALLAYEFVKRLAIDISYSGAKKRPRSIGVISPYKAQADLIESLVLQGDLPKDVRVLAGTIHSFQGDECDIVVAVFNPPTSLGARSQFLNRESIINVAISRARDYLVLFVPDDATDGFDHLRRIKKLIRLCQYEGCWEFSNSEVEKALFGDEKYLDKNVFSTSHQNVNVYTQPERRYEVRVSEDAVDIQFRR